MCDFEEVDNEMLKISIIGKDSKEQFAYIGRKEIDDELEYFSEKIGNNEFIMQTNGKTFK
ncbi:hypothetical protein ACRCD4_06545 [Campylobacter taeniopygiae]